jgi:hypothetical protein
MHDFDRPVRVANRKCKRVHRVTHFDLIEQSWRVRAERRRMIEIPVYVVFEIFAASTLNSGRNSHGIDYDRAE